jgi:hypothetical protein
VARWDEMARSDGGDQGGRAPPLHAPGYLFPLALTTADLICRWSVAHAEPRPNEIFDRLSWGLILPLGITQMGATIWVRHQIGRSMFGWTVLATFASLAAGIAVGASFDNESIRPVMLALNFGPGIPTFIALAYRRLWAPALFVFALLPGLLAIIPR